MITIIPLTGIPEVDANTDLAVLISGALFGQGLQVTNNDIIVVTQKIVSKSEGRWVQLTQVAPTREALELADVTRKDPRLVQLVLDESDAVVRAAPHVLITRTRLGLVMANAGIDQSNIGPGEAERVLLLPEDPDVAAERLADALGCAVVISDSFGRPWRLGVTAVAIGASRLPALVDRRGELDRDRRSLAVTQVAVADLIASAAALATGEGAEGIPVVLIRGYVAPGAARPALALVRPPSEDLFL